MDSTAFSRRDFLKTTLAAGAAAGLGVPLWAGEVEERGGIPFRTLGRTGEKVSLMGLGGFHAGSPLLEGDSIKIIRSALDAGINFMDNCWDYHNGASETRMGKALRDGYRDKAFLMSKIDGRTRDAAAKQIDESLSRLQTDHVDLMQFHEVIRMDDPDRIFAAGGAVEAMQAAQKAGKVRYIGFTGHKSPEIHLHMLDTAAKHGFRFDTVQMPVNLMDAHYDSFGSKVLPELQKQEIGILGMKPIGSGVILKSNTVSAVDCLKFAMSMPVSVCITGCDSMEVLNQALQTVRYFKPLEQKEIAELLAKTAPVATGGQFELYKTSDYFDTTSKKPEYLG